MSRLPAAPGAPRPDRCRVEEVRKLGDHHFALARVTARRRRQPPRRSSSTAASCARFREIRAAFPAALGLNFSAPGGHFSGGPRDHLSRGPLRAASRRARSASQPAARDARIPVPYGGRSRARRRRKASG
ncbi:hypothetical protein NKH77_46995 [Streptomyces sp. M19]